MYVGTWRQPDTLTVTQKHNRLEQIVTCIPKQIIEGMTSTLSSLQLPIPIQPALI